MKESVPHVATSPECLTLPMIWSSRADAIARKILAERIWQCKAMAAAG
jgi:hypothetical protein